MIIILRNKSEHSLTQMNFTIWINDLKLLTIPYVSDSLHSALWAPARSHRTTSARVWRAPRPRPGWVSCHLQWWQSWGWPRKPGSGLCCLIPPACTSKRVTPKWYRALTNDPRLSPHGTQPFWCHRQEGAVFSAASFLQWCRNNGSWSDMNSCSL